MPNEVNIFVQRFGAVLRGPSAYELAVAGGYQGSLEQWLADRQGLNGTNGWSPTLAVVSDGERRVLRVTDWTGGSGTKPTTGQYVGATGLTAVLAEAIDVRGAVGATGTGTPGANAWTPILAVVTDGERRVLQVADWTGGGGTKPTTGQYVGATGLTAVLAEAIDVRGAVGATGTGTPGASAWTPILAVVSDGARRVLQVADWTGGSGTKPTTGQYVGATGLTAVLAEAIDVRGAVGATGTGTPGASAWTPILAVVTDGARRVLQVADWTGGSGTKPAVGQYVGATGLTEVLAEAIDVRGATGTGTAGASAWTPILAVVTDGARRVLQVADWTGGSGTKPTTGVYLATGGFTTVLANAVDIRALANTDGLAEGDTNKWFTDERARAAVLALYGAVGIYTWGSPEFPAAAGNGGVTVLATGIGNVPYVPLISDNTYWRPWGGKAVIYHGVGIFSAAGNGAEQLALTVAIPPSLMTPNSGLEYDCMGTWSVNTTNNLMRVKASGGNIYSPAAAAVLGMRPKGRLQNKTLNSQVASGSATSNTALGSTTSTATIRPTINTAAGFDLTVHLQSADNTTAASATTGALEWFTLELIG